MLDPQALPDWLYLFADDFESVLDFVSSFVRAAVERYRGKVDYWICAGRLSAAEVLTLSEQERLRLVARTVELVRSLDPDTPALVSFDQPWAEYMRQRESDLPPLHFADTLVRAGLGLGGLMLEINVGYWPGGTLSRHPLEFNRQLDTWSLLGLPLWVSVSAPSGHDEDPLAQHKTAIPLTSWTPAGQQAWVARFVPLLLALARWDAFRCTPWSSIASWTHGACSDCRCGCRSRHLAGMTKTRSPSIRRPYR